MAVLLKWLCFCIQAALRHATSQAQVERFEQEVTRMKLDHQLDIKVGPTVLLGFELIHNYLQFITIRCTLLSGCLH